MTTENAVQNINLEVRGAAVPVPQPSPSKSPNDPRKDQTQMGLSLAEPFKSGDVAGAAGITKQGADSQIRRWLYWGWIKSAGYGMFVRTPTFGGIKQHIGYDPSHPKKRTLTKRGLPIKASIGCDFPGCDYIGHGSTHTNALRSVGRHKSVVHGLKRQYVPVKDRVNSKSSYLMPSAANLPSPVINNGPQAQTEPDFMSFCPACGHNLAMHKSAYRIARKHTRKD